MGVLATELVHFLPHSHERLSNFPFIYTLGTGSFGVSLEEHA